MDHQVAADHRESEVGAVEADVLGAVLVDDDVLDLQALAGAEAEQVRVVGDVGLGAGDRGVAARGRRGGVVLDGGDEQRGARGEGARGEGAAARGGGGAHS